ncbi:MAG: heme exporter protein CcmB [Polyangiaceae bacterium]|nr:heme exporter protein CcmB [Polyangiaceae bacterium]
MAPAASLPLQVRRPGPLAVAWEICRKDVRIEMRTGEIVATAGVFSIVVGFLASMAFHVNDATNPSTAAGTIWITVFFAAVLSFGRVWQRERDESALTGLLVAPVLRASIFLGKALSTFLMIAIIEVPIVLLCLFLFHIDFSNQIARAGLSPAEEAIRLAEPARLHGMAFVGLLGMGTVALSAIGTLFGALTVRTRARDLVLAIVLFPLLSPVLVCGVVGSRKAFEAQPFESYSGFLGLMGASAFIAIVLGAGLFGPLVDE